MSRKKSYSNEEMEGTDKVAKKIQKQLDDYLHKYHASDHTTMIELNFSEVGQLLRGYRQMREEHQRVSKFIEMARKI